MTLRLTPAQLEVYQERKNRSASRLLERVAKPSKYRNVPTDVDGIRFASKREARRWKELRLLFKAGEIQGLARQVQFMLPGGIVYVADFLYFTDIFDNCRPVPVIEDAKGVMTKEYVLKKRLMKSVGFTITEV
jgi:hypothetical protein